MLTKTISIEGQLFSLTDFLDAYRKGYDHPIWTQAIALRVAFEDHTLTPRGVDLLASESFIPFDVPPPPPPPRMRDCSDCSGSGEIEHFFWRSQKCSACSGSGQVEDQTPVVTAPAPKAFNPPAKPRSCTATGMGGNLMIFMSELAIGQQVKIRAGVEGLLFGKIARHSVTGSRGVDLGFGGHLIEYFQITHIEVV